MFFCVQLNHMIIQATRVTFIIHTRVQLVTHCCLMSVSFTYTNYNYMHMNIDMLHYHNMQPYTTTVFEHIVGYDISMMKEHIHVQKDENTISKFIGECMFFICPNTYQCFFGIGKELNL